YQRVTRPDAGGTLAVSYEPSCVGSELDGGGFNNFASATLADNTVGGSTAVLPVTCPPLIGLADGGLNPNGQPYTGVWTPVSAALAGVHKYTLTLKGHDGSRTTGRYTLYDDVGLFA